MMKVEQRKDITARLKEIYEELSKSHRKLADCILENPGDAAFLSINELSQKTGISPATITRFAHRLDFQGYSEFQRELYEYQKQRQPFGQLKSLLRSSTETEAAEDPLQWGIRSNLRLLEELYTPQLKEAFVRAQEILLNARSIYIVGHRSSYTTAYYLAFMLRQMREGVNLLTTSNSELSTSLIDVREQDCLVVVSYARYTKATYDVVSHFHREGCKIVALTDSATSPIALKATEVLIAPNGENFSPVGAITICNCFITSLGRQDARRTLERMERQDKITLENNVYL